MGVAERGLGRVCRYRTLAWKGLTTRGAYVAGRHLVSPDGAEGVAVGNLDPEGSSG